MTVEFIGTPGAGKTTLLATTISWFRANGFRPFGAVEAARVYAERTFLGRSIALFSPRRWKDPLMWQAYYAMSTLYGCAFLVRRLRMVRTVASRQRRRPPAAQVRQRRILYWLFRHACAYAFFESLKRNGEVIVFDEGFVHRVVQLNASSAETPSALVIRSYLDELPRPDVVIHVNTPPKACLQRVVLRGSWRHHRFNSVDERFRFIHCAADTVNIAVSHLKKKNWTLIEVANCGTAPEDATSELSEKLSAVLRWTIGVPLMQTA